MPKILIADDHAVVRQGVARILAEAFNDLVCGEAKSAQEALALCERESWDLVVLDVSMPGRSGLELLGQMRDGCKVPVLVLSMHPESAYAVRALKCGASGYLNKLSPPDVLVSAVRKLLSGGKYVTSAVAEQLINDLDGGAGKPPHETLSNREYEVLCLLASGKTPGETASELSLSPKTVSTYRARILEKLNLRTNAELMWYAFQNRLVPQLDASPFTVDPRGTPNGKPLSTNPPVEDYDI